MVTISSVRRGQLLSRFEQLLTQEKAGVETPLQNAVAGLINAIHDPQLTGRTLEQVVQSKRFALGSVLQAAGFSAKDAQDLTKILADQGQQGQGSGGPAPSQRR